jgi:hypothetical protein
MKRLLAFTALPLALAAGMLGAGGAYRAAAAAPQPSPSCILGIICVPGGSSSPTSSASATSASPSPTTASPSPTASQPGGAGPGPSAGPAPSVTPSGPASPSASPSTSTPASGGKTGSPKPAGKAAVKRAAAAPGLVASDATTVLSAGSTTFTNLIYEGNVDMPVAGGGTVAMMKFTADSITLSGDVSFSVTQNGVTAVQSGDTFAFSGGVTFYATQMSGSFLGAQLTFTPSTASAIFLTLLANPVTDIAIPSITLTSTTADQPVSVAGSVQYTPLSVGFGG